MINEIVHVEHRIGSSDVPEWILQSSGAIHHENLHTPHHNGHHRWCDRRDRDRSNQEHHVVPQVVRQHSCPEPERGGQQHVDLEGSYREQGVDPQRAPGDSGSEHPGDSVSK